MSARKRYPIEKSRYIQSLGKLLPHRIGQILEELGFRTSIATKQSNGVDLRVFDSQDNLILVAEILNWSSHTELSEKRKGNILSNLSQYSCSKFIIYTALANEQVLNDLYRHKIILLKIGFQLLPKAFYDFYACRNQIEKRISDSEEAREGLESAIMKLLSSRGSSASDRLHRFRVTKRDMKNTEVIQW